MNLFLLCPKHQPYFFKLLISFVYDHRKEIGRNSRSCPIKQTDTNCPRSCPIKLADTNCHRSCPIKQADTNYPRSCPIKQTDTNYPRSCPIKQADTYLLTCWWDSVPLSSVEFIISVSVASVLVPSPIFIAYSNLAFLANDSPSVSVPFSKIN